ncbi:hypothetical protein [Polaromonas sp. CG_9.11]|uniref:hypothetical protein n=1 Tax=Polaromonas sp. CG_9.11 TaxID=2787730 RepID=UPI0018C8E65B|nr:hypothetical protein [Polaromonas sp. CG_9.11]MBG6074647.1 hypothetical protein [Polaromonas sp. CG_9.11]
MGAIVAQRSSTAMKACEIFLIAARACQQGVIDTFSQNQEWIGWLLFVSRLDIHKLPKVDAASLCCGGVAANKLLDSRGRFRLKNRTKEGTPR